MSAFYDDKMANRLKRAEGQMRGVLRMMEEGKECKDVVTQLTAIRSSIDRTIGLIVAENLVECVTKNQENGMDEKEALREAVNLIVKSRA